MLLDPSVSTVEGHEADRLDGRTLQISLLGGLDVRVGGKEIPPSAWAYRSAARTVLKLLALHPSHRMHREEVIEFLWPDATPASASGSLRKALHALRHALEPDLAPRAPSSFLSSNNQLLELDTQRVRVDADSFQHLCGLALESGDSATLESALEAYTGDLLPEDRYEDWAETKRRELQMMRRELLMRFSVTSSPVDTLGRALNHLKEVVEDDPTDEEATHWLMRLYIRQGSHHAALVSYRKLREALSTELDVEPSIETEQLHSELLSGMVKPSPETLAHPTPVPPEILRDAPLMVGRQAILDFGARQLKDAVAGTGSLMLLSGEPGIGKTRLAAEISRAAIAEDALVLWGTAFEEESLLPYSAFANCLGAYIGSLSRDQRLNLLTMYEELQPLLHMEDPQLQSATSELVTEAERGRVFRGVSRLLTDLADSRPVVLVLDDLHLADSSSLQLLTHLARMCSRLPWLLLVTFRDEALQR